MGCTSFRAWAGTARAWVHPPSLAKSEEFVAFQCLGQILTQRFLHVIFHGRKQELFCRGSEQTRCQLLAGKYHFQPHSQAPTDVSAFQSNGNFMDHFLLLLLFPGMEQQIQNALGTQWSPPETQFRAVSPADQGDRVKPLSCGLGSSGEPDLICHQAAAQRLHCPTAFTGEAQNPPEG